MASVYVYVHAHVHVCVCECAHVCMCGGEPCMCVQVCMYVCVNVHICVNICSRCGKQKVNVLPDFESNQVSSTANKHIKKQKQRNKI